MALVNPLQYPGFDQLLFEIIGADMNVTTDQIAKTIGTRVPPQYVLTSIRVDNASISLDTAVGGFYNAISKPAGGILVLANVAYSGLTGPTLGLNPALTALGLGVQTTAPVFSLTTTQGATATADIRFYGRVRRA